MNDFLNGALLRMSHPPFPNYNKCKLIIPCQKLQDVMLVSKQRQIRKYEIAFSSFIDF